MDDENTEPVIEMAEPETSEEEVTTEEVVEVPEPVTETVETVTGDTDVTPAVPDPEPASEPLEEPESEPLDLEKEEDQEEEGQETASGPADVSAVLARLDALEALLKAPQGTPDETETVGLQERAQNAERELMAYKIGNKYGLPEEVIVLLQGVDGASIEETAKKLAPHFSEGGGLGKGGLDPNEEKFDAKAVAQAYRRANGAR